MVEEVWVGKKVQVLSLEELEKNHYKDKYGYFLYSKKEYSKNESGYPISRLRNEGCIIPQMQKYCGKICEVSQVREDYFRLKDRGCNWSLWMVKEPISIEKVLESE